VTIRPPDTSPEARALALHSRRGVIHRDPALYGIEANRPPELYRVGVNYLAAGAPQMARELIWAAVVSDNSLAGTPSLADVAVDGVTDIDLAYYWALAVLSGRTLDHLDTADFDQLAAAFALGERARAAGKSIPRLDGLDVVERIVRLHAINDTDRGTPQQVISAYHTLPEEIREEVRRHLDLLTAGELRELMDEADGDQLRLRRMARERAERVPKFFRPTPAPLPGGPSVVRIPGRHLPLGGLELAGLGLLLAMWQLVPEHPLAAAATIVLLAAGGLTASRYVTRWLDLAAQSRSRALQREQYAKAASLLSGVDRNSSSEVVDLLFQQHRPADVNEHAWLENTATTRAELAELVAVHQGRQPSPVAPWQYEWLVSWRASQAAEQWRAGLHLEHKTRTATRIWLGTASIASLATVWIGIAVASATMISDQPYLGLLLTLLLAVGTVMLMRYGIATTNVRTLTSDQEWQAQQRAYESWEQYLADTPTDYEMGRWLELDKAHLRRLALQSFGLSDRDIDRSIVLVGPQDGAAQARTIWGPPRYSSYQVHVLLLTAQGVRQLSADLDFASGTVTNQTRMTYRYAAVAAVELVTTEHTRLFRISLINDRAIELPVENFEQSNALFQGEDIEALRTLVQEVSGVTTALEALERPHGAGARTKAQERP
jgi:hypothetical protein